MTAVAAVGESWWQRWPWWLLIVSTALHFFSDNEADNDLWVHLLTGRRILASHGVPSVDDLSYTAAGAAWTDHEWLAQTFLAALFAATGSPGLLAGKLAVGLLTAWLVWRPLARRDVPTWIRGAVMVLALAVLARGFAARPQILTYLFVAWLFAWLDAAHGAGGPRWQVALAALVFVLWANAHGGVIVGLGVLALYAVAPPWSDGRWRWGLLLAAAMAACVNPYGPSLFLYVWRELGTVHPLTEWQPVALGEAAHRPFVVLLGLLLLTAPFGRMLWREPWRAAVVVVTAVMALRHQRHTPLLALCASAPLAEQLAGAVARLRQRLPVTLSTKTTMAIAVGLVGLAMLQMTLLAQRFARDGFRIVYEGADYPVGAVRFLRAEDIRGNLALPLDWGGYVLWHAAPNIKVSLDGRFATVYPASVIETNFAFFRADGNPDAARLLDEYPTTLVLAPRGASIPVRRRVDWRVLYRDEVAELYGTAQPRATEMGHAPKGRLFFP